MSHGTLAAIPTTAYSSLGSFPGTQGGTNMEAVRFIYHTSSCKQSAKTICRFAEKMMMGGNKDDNDQRKTILHDVTEGRRNPKGQDLDNCGWRGWGERRQRREGGEVRGVPPQHHTDNLKEAITTLQADSLPSPSLKAPNTITIT